MSAREEVLRRIRTALDGTAGAPAATHDDRPASAARPYLTDSDLGPGDLVQVLTDRLADYGCGVRRCPPAGLGAEVGAALAARGARRVLLPPGLDVMVPALPGPADGVEFVTDEGFAPEVLDGFDGVLTTAALAVAQTGTIVLDGSPGQGRRALSLIPDYHLCVLRAGQIVGIVPQAIALLRPDRPLTWISGPSATSDIELDRVNGVHGPRTLEVLIVTSAPK